MADPTQIEVGVASTATVAFVDGSGGAADATHVSWSSNNPYFSITPDSDDPTKASVIASSPGHATLTATGTGSNGLTTNASVDIVAYDPNTLSSGEITLSAGITPTKSKKEKSGKDNNQSEHDRDKTEHKK